MFAKASIQTLLCFLLLQACSPAPTPTITLEPTASAVATLVSSAEATAAPTGTATAPPTVGPTATVWPPIFVSSSLQDIRELDSFVVTVNEKNTVNGQLTELTNTIGYIKDPYIAFNENKYYSGLD